ncbi:MAG: hypothetical protein QM582_05285 [Micropruina sp.]|uniref:hypothetical protein n=1 Tax=Micropruina sp. TaxID=2737536 RepID=UPI0039E60C4C
MTLTSSVLTPALRRSQPAVRPHSWGVWAALVISAAALAGQAVPVLGWTAVVFWALVPGLLLTRLVPSTRLPAIGLVPAVSASVTVLLASASLWLGLWQPRVVTAIVAGLAAGYAAMSLSRPTLPALSLPSGLWARVTLGIGALAAVLWLVSLPAVAAGRDDAFGPLAGTPVFAVALLLAVLGFLFALRLRHSGLMWTMLLLSCLIERGTAPLTLDAPSVDWAYKHLGVIDLITSTGTLHRGLDIYQGWPGFFAAIGWVSVAGGVSPFAIACWFTLAVTVAGVAAMYTLSRALRLSVPASQAAAMVALVVNWVAQDYFSPQALGFVLAMVTAALVVRARSSRTAAILSVVVFAALVVSHQLTPFWLLGAIGVLMLFGRVSWWLAALLAAVALGQLAANFEIASAYGLFTGVDVLRNAQTGAAADLGSLALTVHGVSNRVATLGLWGLAGVLAIGQLRRQRWARWRRGPGLVAAVLAFSPFAILFAQSYGGEALLRVMLYSIPGCALLIGPWLTRLFGGDLRARLTGGAALLILAAGASQAYFATYYHYAVTKAEYQAQALLEREVPGRAYLSPGSAFWPVRASEAYAWRLTDDWEYDRPLQNEGDGLRSPDYLAALEAHLENRSAPTYALYGPRMDGYADYRGIAPLGTIDALRETLRTRPGWEVVLDADGVTVFRYVPAQARTQEAATWRP